jgi:hypothetical protein
VLFGAEWRDHQGSDSSRELSAPESWGHRNIQKRGKGKEHIKEIKKELPMKNKEKCGRIP